MNRSELRQRIFDGLNESSSAPIHYSTSQIDDTITEAAEILAEEVEAVPRTVFIPIEEGTTYYYTRAIAPDIMFPKRIWLPDTNHRLTAVSINQLDEQSETWESTTGNPNAWAAVSWDIFAIYPHPASAGGLMRMDYLAWPRVLMDDSDSPEFSESVQDGLIYYAIYDGLLKRYDVQTAQEWLQKFVLMWNAGKDMAGVGRQGERIFSRFPVPHRQFPTNIHERNES